MCKGTFPIRVYLIRQQSEKKWSQRWEKFPPILNALLTNRNHDDDQKKLGEEDRKKQHFLFYLQSKFFDCFCDDWNIFVDQVCETCFPFMTFLFLCTNPNLKTKKKQCLQRFAYFQSHKKRNQPWNLPKTVNQTTWL